MFPQLVGSRAKIEHLTELKIISDSQCRHHFQRTSEDGFLVFKGKTLYK